MDRHRFDSNVSSIVFVSDPEWGYPHGPDRIAELYGLSAAESRVAHALVIGKTLRTFSAESAISLETARNQLKSVYRKTDTHRQAELVHLLLVPASVVG